MPHKVVRFERDQLYEQIWKTPMRSLAYQYGISDVGLRKICTRLNIPLPPRGWHLRSEKRGIIPLPPANDCLKVYEAQICTQPTAAKFDELPEVAYEKQPENRIVVMEYLASLSPLVTAAKRQLMNARTDRYGRVSTTLGYGGYVSVFPESVDRALRILNAICIALKKRGYRVTIDDSNEAMVVHLFGEQIPFRIEERALQHRHQPTSSELQLEQLMGYRTYPLYDYHATGQFSLTIIGRHRNITACSDKETGKIEEKLNTFFISMIKHASQMKNKRLNDE